MCEGGLLCFWQKADRLVHTKCTPDITIYHYFYENIYSLSHIQKKKKPFKRLEFQCFERFLIWWSIGGSNPWPPDCEPGALPAELIPHVLQQCYYILSCRLFQAKDIFFLPWLVCPRKSLLGMGRRGRASVLYFRRKRKLPGRGSAVKSDERFPGRQSGARRPAGWQRILRHAVLIFDKEQGKNGTVDSFSQDRKQF